VTSRLVPSWLHDTVPLVTITKTPHDDLFTEAFGTKQAARGMLQTLLPKSILAKVDLDTLAPVPGTFRDEALKTSQSDLLFSVELAGRPALVYVLLEHKSYHDPWVALQLLRYVVRIWEKALRAEPPPARLPPVIPLVVYHGETSWTASTRLLDILDPLVEGMPELAKLTPRFEFLLDDLNQATDEELLSRTMGLFATLAAILMRDARRKDRILSTLRRVGSLLAELFLAPDGRRAVAILLRYLWLVAEVDAAQATQSVKDIHPEAEKLMMTIAEQISREALEQGREQGRTEAVLAVLDARGLLVTDEQRKRIEETTDLEALDRLVRNAATVVSTDELFKD
jgi:predicted transposase YdaD